jgi:ubiquinone/menaquinone biosynthesis C-methylase UbiE
MTFIDKTGVLTRLSSLDKVVVELGCGATKKIKDAIGIDQADNPGVDIICNLEEGLKFLPDNSVDSIVSFHLLEHISDLGFMMAEFYRVLKPGGRLAGTVPHFSNPYYYSDYTHKTFFGLYTFCYFADETPYKRKVIRYAKSIRFRIRSQKLIFYSPFRILNVFRKIAGIIFNSGIFMQELFEASFSGSLAAYEISFELEKL